MPVTHRRARGSLAAVGALLVTLSACSAPDDSGDASTPSAPPGPTAEWGEWIDVDELVTPVGSSGDTILVSGLATSSVIAFDRTSGDELWRVGGDTSGEGTGEVETGYGNAVLFDDEHVYTQRGSEDGALVAYDLVDGSESWRYDPGALDTCAPTDSWSLSWSRIGSYEVGEPGRLFLSHPEMADPACHTGPNATHPGSPALVVLDAATGEPEGDPLKVSGTSIPSMSRPGVSGEYVYTPYELQGSVNIVRRNLETGEEQSVMLDYPDDPFVLESSPVISEIGADSFHILYMDGTSVEATVDQWDTDSTGIGDVSTKDLGYQVSCEYRMQRSTSDQLYCLVLTSSPDPEDTPAFLAGQVDPAQDMLREDDPKAFPDPFTDGEGSEYYGVVTDPQTVVEDALLPAALTGTPHNGIVLPSDTGLAAFDMDSTEQRWSWDSGSGSAVGAHVAPGVNEVVVGLGDDAVGLDARTGEELWKTPTNGPVFAVADTIVVADYEASSSRVRTTVPLR